MEDSRHDESVVSAYHIALSRLLKLISGFAVISVIVYVLGWLRVMGYYTSFKADWILTEFSYSEFISWGLYPFLALLIGMLLSFTDIANYFVGRELNRIILILLAIMTIQLLGIVVLQIFDKYESAAFIAKGAILASASITMAQFGEVVLELDKNSFRLRSKQINNVFWALFWFSAMTVGLGVAEGDRDKTVSTSYLPHVIIADDPTDHWRLLIARGDVAYLAKLSVDLPSIKIVKVENITTIMPHTRSLKENSEKQENPSSSARLNIESMQENETTGTAH